MASYLDDGDDRRVRPRRLPGRRHQVLGRDRPRPVHAAPRRAPASSSRSRRSASPSYKRLPRTIDVPARRRAALVLGHARHRAGLGLLLRRGAHGRRRRLDDAARPQRPHRQATGAACLGLADLHPFLAHYQTRQRRRRLLRRPARPARGGRRAARATATSSGRSTSRPTRASTSRSRSATPATTSSSTAGSSSTTSCVSTRPGSTSFEDDGDTLDGWTVPGAPAGSAAEPERLDRRRRRRTRRRRAASRRAGARRAAGDHRFLAGIFGPYPFSAAGGIVDDADGLGFALENQTRPIYSKVFFDDRSEPTDASSSTSSPTSGSATTSRSRRWQHIWLNEGFATYAEWLWSEHEGRGTAQSLRLLRAAIPADDPFWRWSIGDPGPGPALRLPVYHRGAMTLHALRLQIGDPAFFRLLRMVRDERGRQRHDHAVHRARRADLRPAARRASSRRGCSRRPSRRGHRAVRAARRRRCVGRGPRCASRAARGVPRSCRRSRIVARPRDLSAASCRIRRARLDRGVRVGGRAPAGSAGPITRRQRPLAQRALACRSRSAAGRRGRGWAGRA